MNTQPYVPSHEHKRALEAYGRLLKIVRENGIDLIDFDESNGTKTGDLYASKDMDGGCADLIVSMPKTTGNPDVDLPDLSLIIFDDAAEILWALGVAYQGRNDAEPWYLHLQAEERYDGRRPVTFLGKKMDGTFPEDVATRQIQLLIGFFKSI